MFSDGSIIVIAACINDVRVDGHWFPMTQGEEAQSFSATLEREESTSLGCVRDNCQDQCPPTFVCVQLWEDFACKYVSLFLYLTSFHLSIGLDKKKLSLKIVNIFLPMTFSIVLGAEKNHLIVCCHEIKQYEP